MLTLISLVAAYIPFIISPLLGSCLGIQHQALHLWVGEGECEAEVGWNRAWLAQGHPESG